MLFRSQILAMTTLLVAIASCSKQDSPEGVDKGEMKPAMESSTPVEPKPNAMLPNEIKADDLSGVNVEQDGSGKKVLYWEDPMVEGRHFNKSGKSPFMDMQLAPRYAE